MSPHHDSRDFERLLESQVARLKSSSVERFDENFNAAAAQVLDWFEIDRLTLYPNSVLWLNDVKTRSFRREGIPKFDKSQFLIGNYHEYVKLMRSDFDYLNFDEDDLSTTDIDPLRHFYDQGGRWHGMMKLELFGQAWGSMGFARFGDHYPEFTPTDIKRLRMICDVWLVYWQYSTINGSLNKSNNNELDDSEKLLKLTKKQASVLALLAQGLSAKQCAEKLYLSPRTIESHKYRMMAMLGFESHSELIMFALRNGVNIEPMT